MKRILCISLISIICVFSIVPFIENDFVYADSIPEGWTNPTTTQELADAFRVYCKSRNLIIDGSGLDVVTSWTTNTFQSACNKVGIDITALQSQIAYKTDGNTGLKWLFTDTGVSAYNRIFAEFLQNNDLAVGDQVNDVTAWEGERFVDDDGNSCLIYEIDINQSSTSSSLSKESYILKYGSYLKYDANELNQIISTDSFYNAEFHIFGRTYSGNLTNLGKNSNGLGWSKITNRDYNGSSTTIITSYDQYWTFYSYNSAVNGGVVVFKINTGRYCIGTFCDGARGASYDSDYFKCKGVYINTDPLSNDSTSNITVNNNVYYTTNNSTINNNNYEGDTIINQDGEPDENDDVPSYNPYPNGGGSTTDETNSGGGDGADDTDITFPNFDFNFPSIDWSIGDLSNKFPFSIPSDLVAFYTVLNASPEAPRIDADIPLGNFYTWHFSADFSQFDNYASIVRNVEFIGFVVGLIYLTVKFVKG